MASHLKNGHEYHLWVYEPLEVPEGVILEDGNEILPESEIFCYSGSEKDGGGSVSAFSNLFRYKLLSERGEWWCDTDVVCLKPFEFDSHVIATELSPKGTTLSTTCVLNIPKEVAAFCYDVARSKDLRNVRWGEIGPELFHKSVSVQNMIQYQTAPWTFCPVHWWDIGKLFVATELEGGYAVHLWNEVWRRDKLDKNGVYQSGCLYERLKDEYLAR